MTRFLLPIRKPIRLAAATLLGGLALAGLPASASAAETADAGASQHAAKPASKSARKPASSRQKLKDEARGLALASETAEAISQAQLDMAARVLTGTADCEFNQHISVQAIEGRPGTFAVGFKGQRYTMTPEETSTGAVRLLDKRAGVVWLQIPTKSMLMNARAGQRMVDACTQPEQRVALAAPAAPGIGILPVSAAPAGTASAPQ